MSDRVKPACIVSDIDDTMLDFMRPLLSVHNWRCGEVVRRENILEYKLPESVNDTLIKYEDDIYKSLPILPKVKSAIKSFRKAGYKIILMTARDEKYREATEFNLAINEIDYDELFFNKNKSLKINRLSEKYDIKYFVDDRLETVNRVKRDTNVPDVYLINTYANRNEDVEDGVKRINNIYEIEVK